MLLTGTHFAVGWAHLLSCKNRVFTSRHLNSTSARSLMHVFGNECWKQSPSIQFEPIQKPWSSFSFSAHGAPDQSSFPAQIKCSLAIVPAATRQTLQQMARKHTNIGKSKRSRSRINKHIALGLVRIWSPRRESRKANFLRTRPQSTRPHARQRKRISHRSALSKSERLCMLMRPSRKSLDCAPSAPKLFSKQTPFFAIVKLWLERPRVIQIWYQRVPESRIAINTLAWGLHGNTPADALQ